MKLTSLLSLGLVASWMVSSFSFLEAQGPAERQQMVKKAVGYLSDVGQAEDGSFSSKTGPGVTGLVVAGLLSVDLPPDHPVVAKSLKYLQSTRHEDGGLYAPKSTHANYETCLAIMAFSKANQDGKYNELIRGAEKFVKLQQWDEGEGIKSDDVAYGGALFPSTEVSSRSQSSRTY